MGHRAHRKKPTRCYHCYHSLLASDLTIIRPNLTIFVTVAGWSRWSNPPRPFLECQTSIRLVVKRLNAHQPSLLLLKNSHLRGFGWLITNQSKDQQGSSAQLDGLWWSKWNIQMGYRWFMKTHKEFIMVKMEHPLLLMVYDALWK